MGLSYCDFAASNPFHSAYHDTEYGFPSADEAVLFERLVLEINQAGLSWLTILRKRPAFRAAYAGFAVDRVAAFDESDRSRLLADEGIIRNRLKVDAAIANAKVVQDLRSSQGGFANWLDAHHPLSKDDWVKLFRKTFRFTGGEIVNEFLVSLGYLPGAHALSCPIYPIVGRLAPPWMRGLTTS